MNSIPEVFGSAVFNDEKMRERLPKDVYESLKKTAGSGARLEPSIANVVAEKMKEYGCTEALNLDGGDTVALAFNNKVILHGNMAAKKLRNLGSMIAFGERGER